MSKSKGSISLYARRFHSLLVQLKEKGYSQTEIAVRLGVSQGHISRWGNIDSPGRWDIGSETIEKVTKARWVIGGREVRISGGYFTDLAPPDTETRKLDNYVVSLDEVRRAKQIDDLSRSNAQLIAQNEKLERLLDAVSRRLEVLESPSSTKSKRSQ